MQNKYTVITQFKDTTFEGPLDTNVKENNVKQKAKATQTLL